MSRRFKDALNIDELREIARRRVPRFAFDYVDGGAEDERTLAGNRAAFERLRFRPRTMVDVSVRDTATTILGHPASFPAIVGPTGLNGLQWPNGDLAIAHAAAAAGLPFAMSTVSMSYIEDLARAASGRLWLQAYVFREREISDRLIDRAETGGCDAIIITSDFPTPGKRERDLRSGLLPKQEFPLRTTLDILRHPRWILTVARNKPRFVNVERELGPGANVNNFVGHNMFDPSLDWDDLARFRDRWKRKLLLKGVLRADDAERAAALGVDGVWLSNHGGRQLDGAISGMDALPEVIDAVGRRLAIIVDGGVRRGSDIAKAVALGATAVALGRAPVYGLGAGGEAGAARALEILRDEFDRTLALTGCRAVADLTPDLVTR
ncbi:MAG: 2-hydroxy-acid oxidase [Proteobacteria bacterium]|nr:2-hydroxy-acid oxidase [Pseudomonadota bacterium]